jgi:death-on-curing protein
MLPQATGQKVSRVWRLSIEDVLAIRARMAATFLAKKDAFGSEHPLYPDRLEMAVERQNTSLGGRYKYDSVWDVAATLFFGLTLDHPFENGNKRTALVCTLVFLDRNKRVLVGVSEDELYELARSVATHEVLSAIPGTGVADDEVQAIASFFRARGREVELGDHPIEFMEMKRNLEALGCTFDPPKKNFVKIHRLGKMVKAGYPRKNYQVSVSDVKRIRRRLGLAEEHGVDSGGFYDLDERVDAFVNTYGKLMQRLANV